MNEIAIDLVEVIKELAPEIWAIYLRQVYISATVGFLVWGSILAGITVFIVNGFKRGWFAEWNDTDELITITIGVCLPALIIISLITLTYDIQMLLNPEFYAIEMLLDIGK